jgi:hypothetical protein
LKLLLWKMPPKKAQQLAKDATKKQKQEDQEQVNGIHDDRKPRPNNKGKDENPSTKKRKMPPTKTSKPAKEPRQGAKASSRGKDAPTQKQLLQFLLSEKSLSFCYPEDELNAKASKKYSSTSPTTFSPFEHLLTASLLSKPLSHMLGMRSTRTLLNPPFSFNSAKAIAEAGEKRVWEALEVARTQHRQKTASYVIQMAEHFADDPNLKRVKQDPVSEVQKVKGIGKTGAELFCRRVQCLDGWDGVFPSADGKSLEACKEVGLDVKDAEDLDQVMEREVDWTQVGNMGLENPLSELRKEQKQRLAFVLVLERAIGASLEGKLQDVRKAAAAL